MTTPELDVTDLDALVPPAKRVKLGGELYDVPADMPMEIFLRTNLAGTLKDEDGEPDYGGQITELRNCIVDLITWDQPDTDKAKIQEQVRSVIEKRGVKWTFELLRTIYKDVDAEGEVPPTEDQAP